MTDKNRGALAALMAEQRGRWLQGDSVAVEDYLKRYPDLDDDAVLDLIYNEIFLREQYGEQATLEEYLRRFPRWQAELRLQFEVHAAIQPEPEPDPVAAVPGYELQGELGRGAMGIVYRARDLTRGRTAAVKMLLPKHFQQRGVLKRFLGESRALGLLTHPNIVAVHEVGEGKAGPYLVMELIEGPSLEMFIHGGPLAAAKAVGTLLPIIEAVEYAHRQGVIHRDLKPSNILLAPGRGPVVLDFGMAKVPRKRTLGPSSTSTQPGTILGTPAYMPPEQTGVDLSPPGPYSDVYSLGALLYALLTGRPPYNEGSALDTILKVRSPEPPPPPSRLRPDVPAALELVCMRCLCKPPEHRYPTAQALAEALRRAQGLALPSAAAASATGSAAFLVAETTGQRHPLAVTGTVLGRSADCEIVVPDPAVSRRHCRIRLGGGQAIVEDLESSRGTLVNGRRVEWSRLQDGDRLDLGGQVFVFHRAGKDS
jgi:tRNA A-37 threonylcarbamoyl transferase component Bud32